MKYSKFPLKNIKVNSSFGYRDFPKGTTTFHRGVDLGKNTLDEEVYFANDCEIISIKYSDSAGNYVVTKTNLDDKTIINRYLHLKNLPTHYKIGDKKFQGEVVGIMGTTGNSTGVHLHFEHWECPKDYKYNFSDISKYAKDPMEYNYLFDDQTSNIKNIHKVIGTQIKTTQNNNINQIEVYNTKLRCRKEPNLNAEIIGYIDIGFYKILEETESDGYTWYKIDENKYIAHVEGTTNVYKSNVINTINEEETNTYNKTIIELNNKIKELELELEKYKKLKKFISKKEDNYYIHLLENEIVYYED